MARRYLFVYDPRDRSFPERYAVPGTNDDGQAAPAEDLQGWISADEFEARRAALRARFPAAPFEVEEMYATSWQALARNYPGMRR